MWHNLFSHIYRSSTLSTSIGSSASILLSSFHISETLFKMLVFDSLSYMIFWIRFMYLLFHFQKSISPTSRINEIMPGSVVFSFLRRPGLAKLIFAYLIETLKFIFKIVSYSIQHFLIEIFILIFKYNISSLSWRNGKK